jgi:hypothetical protein
VPVGKVSSLEREVEHLRTPFNKGHLRCSFLLTPALMTGRFLAGP